METIKEYALADIVTMLAEGNLPVESTFESESGCKIGHKHGELYWLTSGGYVSTPVYINEETAQDRYYQKVAEHKVEVTFMTALEALIQGAEKVIFTVGDHEWECKNECDFMDLLSDEYIADLYNSKAYIYQELQPFDSISVENPKPNITVPQRETEQGHKLTQPDVYNIHKQYHQLKKDTSQLAQEYNISMRMVQYILEGKRWNHVYKKYHLSQTR